MVTHVAEGFTCSFNLAGALSMTDDSDSVSRAKEELKQAISSSPVSEPDPALSVLVPDQVLDRQDALTHRRGSSWRERKTSVSVARELLKKEQYLSDVNWSSVYNAYAQTSDPTHIASLTGLAVPDVNHLLNHGIQRLGLPAIKKHAVNADEIQRIIGQYRRDLEPIDPSVQSAVEDRAAREALAAQGALDIVMETSGLLHALIAQVRQTVQAGGLQRIEQVTPKLIQDLISSTRANTQALKMAVEMSRLTAGEPTNVITVQLAALVAQCTPEEIAEAARTRQLPPSIRRSGKGIQLPSEAGDISEAIGTSTAATQALEAWEKLRGKEGEGEEGEGEES